METLENMEIEKKQPQKAYLFDVDGVLTNPHEKKVMHPEILDELTKRLEMGYPIGLNTGRSLEFVTTNILDPLEEKITEKKLLQNIIALGEKGCAWITYDDQNNRVSVVDEMIKVPEFIGEKIRSIVNTPPYCDVMFFDETKKTMVSLEVHTQQKLVENEKTFEEFKRIQKKLSEELDILLNEHQLQNEFKIDVTRIATDVENVHVGKALGARRFVELLAGKNIDPQEFLSFGDSPSDYEMFTELQQLGKKAQFIYVGESKDLEGKKLEDVIFTERKVDDGTSDFLKSE
jgi:HAD superfamily hydrolase (TIGR01484 family)